MRDDLTCALHRGAAWGCSIGVQHGGAAWESLHGGAAWGCNMGRRS